MTKKKKPKTPTASIETVFRWFEEFEEGVFQVLADPIEVYKGERKLAQRINLRQRMDDGDARVDLWHEGLRRSCHVSQLVWMVNAGMPIPKGFEIHHLNEDIHDNHFANLVCVHSLDHAKLHGADAGLDDLEDVPLGLFLLRQ